MKKVAIVIMLFAMILSMLGGCFKIPKNLLPKPSASDSSDSEDNDTADSEDNDDSNSEDSSDSDDLSSLKPAGNASEGFSNYSTYKSSAYDRVVAASEKSDSLAMTVSMSFLGIAMVDLSLITLAMLSEDLQSSQMAMGMLGMEDAKITGNGNDYTISYTDQDGATIKQTCTYDAGKDQMTSTLYDADGKIAMFFEYVYLGDAYVAQYYYPSGDSYEIIRSYFDIDNVAAFGIVTASDEPASIIGKSGFNAEFVKNEQSYLLLEDGELTVFDQGTTTTN